MNRQILHIAIPSIISNVTVPLLALVDTTIVGHLGAASYIGAIAIGGMIFNMMYWLFSFLRMGTGGFTAQACGAGDRTECLRVLARSLSVACVVGGLMLVFQHPLFSLVSQFLHASPEVQAFARVYYDWLIWGAPAVLSLYSFNGWFLGMQNARLPMLVAIVQNVVNVLASLTLVYGVGLKLDGVAVGTLVAQYVGVALAFGLCIRYYRPFADVEALRGIFVKEKLWSFFHVNRDIFLRTLCMICVTTYFTSLGASQGDLTLAANALLMQFFMFFSYVMDGFAYAGEAIGGRCLGASDRSAFWTLTKYLFRWGWALAVLFTAVYALMGTPILHLLTDNGPVVETARLYLPFASAIPVLSMAAFVFDGLFVGTTATRPMLLSMFVAMCIFLVVVWFFPMHNTTLWGAFLAYLCMRGLMQACLFFKILRLFRA